MRKKRHTPEEIVSKLRQVDVLVSQGTPVADAFRSIGVTEVDHHRELATTLQFCSAACLSGLPAPSSGGVRAGLRGLAGCAHPTDSAGPAPRSATTDHELTFTPDHPMGADHPSFHNAIQAWTAARDMVKRKRNADYEAIRSEL